MALYDTNKNEVVTAHLTEQILLEYNTHDLAQPFVLGVVLKSPDASPIAFCFNAQEARRLRDALITLIQAHDTINEYSMDNI